MANGGDKSGEIQSQVGVKVSVEVKARNAKWRRGVPVTQSDPLRFLVVGLPKS